MTEGKSLSSALAGSNEVTSLSGTDRILAFSSSGERKKISRANLLGLRDTNAQQEGWLRIMSYNAAGDTLLSISNGWSSLRGNFVLLALIMNGNNNNFCDATVLANMGNNGTPSFTKIRFVNKSLSEGYIDIWYPGSTNPQSLRISMIQGRNVTLIPPELNATVPEGYTSKEVDITKPAWGG